MEDVAASDHSGQTSRKQREGFCRVQLPSVPLSIFIPPSFQANTGGQSVVRPGPRMWNRPSAPSLCFPSVLRCCLVLRRWDAGDSSRQPEEHRNARQLWRGTCLSKRQIIQAAESSLKRLKTDYIDLFQLHWPDRYVPSHASGDYSDVLFDPKVRRDG